MLCTHCDSRVLAERRATVHSQRSARVGLPAGGVGGACALTPARPSPTKDVTQQRWLLSYHVAFLFLTLRKGLTSRCAFTYLLLSEVSDDLTSLRYDDGFCGLSSVPRIHMLTPRSPVSQSVTVFGDGAFRGAIEVKWGLLGGPHSTMTGTLIREYEGTDTRRDNPVRTRRGWLLAKDTALCMCPGCPSCCGLWWHAVSPKTSCPLDLTALCYLLLLSLPPLPGASRPPCPKAFHSAHTAWAARGSSRPVHREARHPRVSGGLTLTPPTPHPISLPAGLCTRAGTPLPAPTITSQQPRAEPRAGME